MNVARLPLYVGGFLGPFGGAVLSVLIPEVRSAFDVPTSSVASAVTAYLVPFAALMLVSGTIGERVGRRRTIRAAYALYGTASILAAFAPSMSVFLVARALQGTANAFTTPLLLAALADLVPPAQLGRAIGTFAGIQAGALALAPLLGGLAAEVNWRIAFIGGAAVSAILLMVPPADGPRRTRPALLRSLVNWDLAIVCAAGFVGYLGVSGLSFLVSLRLFDSFAPSASVRGLVLAGYGLAGLALGSLAGRAVERRGWPQVAAVGAIASALCVTAVGVAPTLALACIAWFLAGAGSAALWAGVNTAAVTLDTDNRAGSISVFTAFKFGGAALAPLVWLAVYQASPAGAFAAAGLVTSTVALTGPLLTRRQSRSGG